MKITCVIPTYNEKENIIIIVKQIMESYPDLHILIVDDNSPDGTGQLAEQMKKENSKIDVLHRQKKEGLGKAYLAGFKKALADGADIIIQMDADLSHNPVYIKDFLREIESNDVVLGSRYLDGISIVNWPLSRLIISYFGNVYARIATGLKLTDLTGGFKCIRRKVLESFDFDKIQSNGYSFQIEMNNLFAKRGFKVKEVQIIFFERTRGKSNMSKGIILEAIFKVPFYRWKKY